MVEYMNQDLPHKIEDVLDGSQRSFAASGLHLAANGALTQRIKLSLRIEFSSTPLMLCAVRSNSAVRR